MKGYITKGYIVGLHHPQEKRLKFCGHRETRSLWMQYAVGWCILDIEKGKLYVAYNTPFNASLLGIEVIRDF